MFEMLRDVMASRALDEQPIFDPKRCRAELAAMEACPPDQKPAFEGRIQRIVSTALMHQRFGMSSDLAA